LLLLCAFKAPIPLLHPLTTHVSGGSSWPSALSIVNAYHQGICCFLHGRSQVLVYSPDLLWALDTCVQTACSLVSWIPPPNHSGVISDLEFIFSSKETSCSWWY
jgi:hypothetical protein